MFNETLEACRFNPDKLVEMGSVVFAPDLEVASRMLTNWAFVRCFTAFKNVATVPAFPFDR